MPARAWSPCPWVITARGTGRHGSMWKPPGGQYSPSGVATTSPGAGIRPPCSAQVDLADLVAVVLLGVDAEQHLHPGQHAVGVDPDLGLLGVQPQQAQLGIVLALVPGGHEGIPQALDHGAVGIHAQRTANACEQVVALGGEAGDGAAAALAEL